MTSWLDEHLSWAGMEITNNLPILGHECLHGNQMILAWFCSFSVAISTSVFLVGAGVVVAFLAWFIKSRQTSQPGRADVETMETVPMTVRASSSSKEDGDTAA